MVDGTTATQPLAEQPRIAFDEPEGHVSHLFKGGATTNGRGFRHMV